jgi:hypothetical protein
MSPVTPIEFACVYDTEVGQDGQLYMAQYMDGVLCWVCVDGGSSSQDKPKASNKSKQKSKSNKYPTTPLDFVSQDDIHTGEDGNLYIAKIVKGRMSWSLHTKSHDWNSTTITFINITPDDLNNCIESKSMSTGSSKSRKRPSKKT